MISHSVPARVGLLGNPSDGYGGRTLALAVTRFTATVEATRSDRLEIVPLPTDRPEWESVGDLVERVDAEGYGTGPQLLAASIRTFVNLLSSVVDETALERFRERSFTLRYRTSIPRQVGLAGSSALVIATLRCLIDLANDGLGAPSATAPSATAPSDTAPSATAPSDTALPMVPDEVLASVALAVEADELGLSAGLQDRVVQSMGGLVAMDFGRMTTNARFGVSHGQYRRIDDSDLPPLFVAFRPSSAEPSDRYHSVLRERFDAGDATVRELLNRLAGLAVEGEAALRWRNPEGFGQLLAENMRLRRQLAPISDHQLELVDVASEHDAPTTFGGSGGAVVGVYHDVEHLESIRAAMAAIDAEVVDLA